MYGHIIYGSLFYMAYMVLYGIYGSIYNIHRNVWFYIWFYIWFCVWFYMGIPYIYMVLYGNKRTYLVKCWYGGELLRKHRVGYVFLICLVLEILCVYTGIKPYILWNTWTYICVEFIFTGLEGTNLQGTHGFWPSNRSF